MTMPLVQMTREKANEILRLWKYNLGDYPLRVIRMALYVTGDLESLR
jgi:uncharacterized membrane protein